MPPRTDGYIPPCIPTRAYKMPAGPDWVHEIKHDGYRLAFPGIEKRKRDMDVIEACRAVLTVGGYRKLMEWYPDDGLQRAVSLALIMIEERPVKPEISNALKRYRPTSILDLHSEDILRPPDQPKPFWDPKA
jgi:hypothetical protein